MRLRYKGIIILALLIATVSMSIRVDAARNQNDTFTVVIDAGHGGHDTGAVDNGAREKDINLGVAKKLAALIERKMKHTNVVMTRNNDTFVSLQERADIANRNKGDLFISIHTNSLDKNVPTRKSAKGTSVYVLGLHKDDNNLKVARRENAVIELESDYEQKYSGFDPNKDESYIIFEMSQKQNLGQSLRFAKDAQKELVRTAGRNDRGVKQAGFWVLWSTSMPAVLVELDFICNPESAKYLTSESGQTKLAQSLFNAIEDFGKKNLARKSELNKKKEKKSRKKSDRRNSTMEASAGDVSPEQADDLPVLVSASNKAPRVVSSSQDNNATRGNEMNYAQYRQSNRHSTGSRRRRSAAAKMESDAKVFDSGKILIKYENDNLARTIAPVTENSAEIAAVDNSNASTSKKTKQKKGVVKKKSKKDSTDKNSKNNSANKGKNSADKNTKIIVSGNQTTIKTSSKGKTKITVKSKKARRHTSLAGKRK